MSRLEKYRGVDDRYPHELLHAGCEDLVSSGRRRKANILLDVSAVHESEVDCFGDVGCCHDHYILELLQLVNLGEECVHHPYGIRRLVAIDSTLASSGETLHFINEHDHEALRVVDKLLDGGEELVDQLAALAEPLAEEGVGVDLDELAKAEAVRHTDRQLLREGLAKRSLAGAGGAVEEDYAVPADDGCVDSLVCEVHCRGRVLEEMRLDLAVVDERIPQVAELDGRQRPDVAARSVPLCLFAYTLVAALE
mmetsp:Transcript_48160/g.117008  ORF Transcript_48160/g.117008 Transcript_48160/m.117008 type:complete len:252 (-) Transcript_48160:378-1133(-)